MLFYTICFRLSLRHGQPSQQLLSLVSSCDLNFSYDTLFYELDLDKVKANHLTKSLSLRSFNYISREVS